MAEKKAIVSPTKKAAGDKKTALETALSQIEKQFGKGAVMKLGARPMDRMVEMIFSKYSFLSASS